MQTLRFHHLHPRSADPNTTANFFTTLFGAEGTCGMYPPGTLYPEQMRMTMMVGGQKIPIAPTHPDDPMTAAPAFPYYGPQHFGFTVEDLDAMIADLRGKGADVAVGRPTRDAGTYLTFIRGPDGIMVELVQQRRSA